MKRALIPAIIYCSSSILVTAETHNFHDAERQTKAKIHRNLSQSSCYKITTNSSKAKWPLDVINEVRVMIFLFTSCPPTIVRSGL